MTAVASTRRALELIERDDAWLRAWAHVDAHVASNDALRVDRAGALPLRGVTLGVKDNIDTADLPTECGSAIYLGFRPRMDAAAVALLRAAGAVLIGKTVTVEFAYVGTGPTRNPHAAAHTPGGSSMGSAAAVAAGHVDVALGTQTGGSVTRPASYCGVFAFKPTFGAVSTGGVELLCPSLDTVGWFARDLDLLERVFVVLTGAAADEPAPTSRAGLLRSENWHHADGDSRGAVLAAAAAAPDYVDLGEVSELHGLTTAQRQVMGYEAARTLGWARTVRPDLLTARVRDEVERDALVAYESYRRACSRRDAARTAVDRIFGPADVLITPAVTGEAPAGHEHTGDPVFARTWTLLGLPTVSLPWSLGATGLPVSVQLVGRPGEDRRLLAFARQLAASSPRLRGTVVPATVPARS